MDGSSTKRYVIVVAGGTGTRMQSVVPKQFMRIGGEPILVHTLRQFVEWDAHIKIIVVMHADLIAEWRELAKVNCPEIEHHVVPGGKERFDSVKAGLTCIEDAEAVVGIHDAVRPLVTKATLERCYTVAHQKGSAIPCVPVTDSIRMVDGEASKHLDRSVLRAVQTPQCFKLNLLVQAYNLPYQTSFTDDASVLEAAGIEVHLVEGNRENIKITNPEDLLVAESLLNRG